MRRPNRRTPFRLSGSHVFVDEPDFHTSPPITRRMFVDSSWFLSREADRNSSSCGAADFGPARTTRNVSRGKPPEERQKSKRKSRSGRNRVCDRFERFPRYVPRHRVRPGWRPVEFQKVVKPFRPATRPVTRRWDGESFTRVRRSLG